MSDAHPEIFNKLYIAHELMSIGLIMGLKLEVIGNNFVLTDTDSAAVKLERPAADVYGVCKDDRWMIYSRAPRPDLLESGEYEGLVNSSGTVLDRAGLAAFFRANLGFPKAGTSALSTLSEIASELQKAYAVGRFYGPDINRHASVFNRVNMRRERATFIPTGSSAAGKRRLLTYATMRVGSGSRKTLTVTVENQFMDVSVAGCPPVPNTNSLLVTGAQIQRNVFNSPIVQLKINGVNAANNLTLAPTDYDIVFDDLRPQDFGRSSFAVDETFIAQIEIEVNYNEFWPTIEGNDLFSMEGYIYDPAVSTWNRTNTAQPASPTWTTGADRWLMSHGWGIIALGKFSDGDPLTLNAFGDSIIAAANGASYIGRLYSRSKIAGCIVARGSAHSGALTAGGARATYLTKYGSSAIIEHGTNTASETLAQMQARINTAIALVRNASVVSPRNNKFNVILTNLLVAENRTNNTIIWNAGGTVEQYNTWMYTQIGLPTGPDIVVDGSVGPFGTIRASTEGKGVTNSDYYRFGAGMTSDGAAAFVVHLTSAAAIIMADNIAPQLPVY